MILHRLYNFLKKQYYLKILKRRYYRHGSCLMCGECCRNIYVRHGKNIIKTTEQFEKIKENDSYTFYQHIKVIGQDEFGLIFECEKFNKEKKICTDHKNRPHICSNYPSEEIFKMGAELKEGCGYSFEPIEKFDEVFKKVMKKPIKKFEELED